MKNKVRRKIDAEKTTKACIEWIKRWLCTSSGGGKGIVIGISGGADSTVCAKLCAEAIGKDKVYGLLMPNGVQHDIDDAVRVCQEIGIEYNIRDISGIYNEFLNTCGSITDESKINISPRIRMILLYAYAQNMSYRVVGTGNFAERYVGYCTKHGDMACDFNPLENLLKSEIVEIGDYLGLPYDLVHKTPSDGLCGKTDEENLGFTYQQLEDYIKLGKSGDKDVNRNIQKKFKMSSHKRESPPSFYAIYYK